MTSLLVFEVTLIWYHHYLVSSLFGITTLGHNIWYHYNLTSILLDITIIWNNPTDIPIIQMIQRWNDNVYDNIELNADKIQEEL